MVLTPHQRKAGSPARSQTVMDANVNDLEKRCIRILATLYNEGHEDFAEARELLREKGMELEYIPYVALMGMMEQYGVISKLFDILSDTGKYYKIRIKPYAVQAVREI